MRIGTLLLVFWLVMGAAWAAPPARFTCVVLGSEGGLDEGALSAYLLAAAGSDQYLCLDAGTLVSGLRAARRAGTLISPEGEVLRKQVKAYLISHAHVDHIAGLIIGSTDDSAKPVMGLPSTIAVLRDDVFNWRVWPNFGNEGANPLRQYAYTRVPVGEVMAVPGTPLSFEAWPLSHGGCTSTAFLVFNGEDAVLYLGDTGPDEVEHAQTLGVLWTRVAPLVRAGRLHAIFLEASYPDGRPDKQLFGHLTPAWMMKELHRLADACGGLTGMTVVVTHVKPLLDGGVAARDRIEAELRARNDLGVKFVMPVQGQRIDL